VTYGRSRRAMRHVRPSAEIALLPAVLVRSVPMRRDARLRCSGSRPTSRPLGGGCKPRGATESSTAPETPRVLANSATRYAGVGAVYVVQNHRYHRGELGGVWAEAVGSRISDATHLLLDISAPSCYVSAVSVTSAASSVKGRRWSGWHASRPGGSIWL